ETTLGAYDHQLAPFEKVVERVVKTRDMNHTPLFQVMFILQNTPENENEESSGIYEELTISPYEDGQITSKYDLTMVGHEDESGISLSLKYNKELFKTDTVHNFLEHYKELLYSIVQFPKRRLSELSMFTVSEEQQLLEIAGTSNIAYPKEETIVDLFEIQARKTPNTTALVSESYTLTYTELDERSNQLARYLKNEYGAEAGMLIGICSDRSLEMIVGILAILKLGSAYVPIDPEFPEDRIAYMLDDSNVKIVLTHSQYSSVLPLSKEITIVALDSEQKVVEKEPVTSLNTGIIVDSPVYVIYTSGSTGRPKGVLIKHSNLSDYIHGLLSSLEINGPYSYGLMSTVSADLGNTVLFGSLLSGGTLHTFSKDALKDAYAMGSYFNQNTIDYIKIVPSHWSALESEYGPLLPESGIIFGGDILTPTLVDKIKNTNKAIKVINHYGPTETTIGKLLHKVDLNASYQNIPIGTPFSDTKVYILDAHGGLLPRGVVGELCIGGAGVS
ncbi:non-ribosomal peptide synthetase, partial [Maribacter sp. 2-571]|uniref:non-ribosomal peptide synthetase n=1 Tax=Maribacter sp. 2-571 TaxID=3417569 RepID=UPI003D3515A5